MKENLIRNDGSIQSIEGIPQMIKDRYISTLLNFNNKQILNGMNEIKNNYKKVLKFKDRLICFIIEK